MFIAEKCGMNDTFFDLTPQLNLITAILSRSWLPYNVSLVTPYYKGLLGVFF